MTRAGEFLRHTRTSKSDPDISKRLFGNDAFRLSPRQELFLDYYLAACFAAF